ncbi:double-strand break repair protein MRE11-like [Oppia nitens]|uniref:double-strand break repair protein MRE11-like n=1 Tax=Oppia nitens TaxID=1686743 RepID=UPI0023DB1CE8|nr:double-strand break repair protein MRE11-like [Oppia nitens]
MSDIDYSKTFRILVASDLHIGYNERHPERGDDSFRTFEEVLHMAKDEDVDLLLLGGDLFHHNKPSFATLEKTVNLFRENCFGDKPIQFRIVSDQTDNFSHYKNDKKFANYLDDNLNISLPVFTIHGNHDDPIGPNHITALDTLSSAGLVNYFGKYTNVDEILLTPILLEKSNCKIALFGLGSVNEERLYRIFTDNKFNYCMPETNEDDWFKIVVVHQNRIKHPNTKYLPEKFLSDLPQLVIWGHEHESRPECDYNETEQFFVYQPGSTVATSLCEAEALPKHVGLLEVFFDEMNKTPQFRIRSRKLKTVRPFVWESIDIHDLIQRNIIQNDEEMIIDYCRDKVEEMIQKARLEHTGDSRQPKLPLIRLRLEYTDSKHQFHSAQFGAQFNGRVANPSEIIHYVKRRVNRVYEEEGNIDINEMRAILDNEVITERVNLTTIIKEYFDKIEDSNHKLGLLSENALTLAVTELVEKESTEAINDVYSAQKENMKQCLLSLEDLKVEDIRDEIRRIKNENTVNSDSQDLIKILAESRTKAKSIKTEVTNGDENGAESEVEFETTLPVNEVMSIPQTSSHNTAIRSRGRAVRSRGRGRGRGVTVKSEPRSTQSSLDFQESSRSSSRRRSPRTPAKKPKYEDFVVDLSSDTE